MINLYEVLQVGRDASLDEIQKNFRLLAKRYHPDKNYNTKESTEYFRLLLFAYETLKDAERRRLYDIKLNSYINRKNNERRAYQYNKNQDAVPSTNNTANNKTTVNSPCDTKGSKKNYTSLIVTFLAVFALIFAFVILCRKDKAYKTEDNSENSKELSFNNKQIPNKTQFDTLFYKDELGRIYGIPANKIDAIVKQFPNLSRATEDDLLKLEEIRMIKNEEKTNETNETTLFDENYNSKRVNDDDFDGWERLYYQTGVSPDCSNITPLYDTSINNYLNVSVGQGTDAVVKLIEFSTDDCIRIVYVRGGDTFRIKNIPQGYYYLKIAYGKDYRKKVVNGKCQIKFIKNAMYKKGEDILDYNIVNNQIPSYSISLIVTDAEGEVLSTNNISEHEFNK